jgi:hypothetical protein
MPGSEVDLSLDGTVDLGTVTAGEDGTFCVNVVLPAGTSVGDHDIVATGENSAGEPRTVVLGIEVGPPPTDTIGGPSTPMLADGPGRLLILLGVLLLVTAAAARPVSRAEAGHRRSSRRR